MVWGFGPIPIIGYNMTDEERRLAAMLELSENVKVSYRKPDPEYWFSWPNQQKLVFEIARQSFVEFDVAPEEAIKNAREFVDAFYKLEIKH